MIRTREQLLNWLEKNAPRPCIRRAIREGQRVENFGGFNQIRPDKYSPGWIVRIISRFGKQWDVGVWYAQGHNLLSKPYTEVLKAIPWEQKIPYVGANPLYSGDHPEKYPL